MSQSKPFAHIDSNTTIVEADWGFAVHTLFFRNFLNRIHGGGIPIFPHQRGVAFRAGDAFVASPVKDDGTEYAELHPGKSISDLKAWVATTFGDHNPTESDYEPGTVYKRIYRPLACSGSLCDSIDLDKRMQSFVALRILLSKLEAIFQVIEPTSRNLKVYGHLVRELLLLASMEVETSLAAVLKENSYTGSSRFTTNDYVKLKNVMLLDRYELSLNSYPQFPKFNPFDGWDALAPTKSLPWYDAYNGAKHDRESNLHLATLEQAVHSVGAAAVLFFAQYGLRMPDSSHDVALDEIRSVFWIVTDQARYPNSCYIPRFTIPMYPTLTLEPDPKWKAVSYPF